MIMDLNIDEINAILAEMDNIPSPKHGAKIKYARCSYCEKPIFYGQPAVPDDYGSQGNEWMHIGCACERQDGDDIDNEHGDE